MNWPVFLYVFVAAVGTHDHGYHHDDPWEFTEGTWEQGAKFLKQGLKETVQPCDDFYEFSCASWYENSGRGHDNEDRRMHKYNQIRMVTAIEGSKNSSKIYAKRLHTFLNHCKASKKLTEDERINHLFSILVRKIGYPKMFQLGKNKKSDLGFWQAVAIGQKEFSTNIFFGVTARSKHLFFDTYPFKNEERCQDEYENILTINPGIMIGFTRGMDVSILELLNRSISQLAKLNNVQIDESFLANKVQKLLDIANKVQSIVKNDKLMSKQAVLYDIIDYGTVKTRYANVDWDVYFNKLFSHNSLKPYALKIAVQHPEMMNELNKFLGSEKESDDLFDYLVWKTLMIMYDEAPNPDGWCLYYAQIAYPLASVRNMFDYYGWNVTEWIESLEHLRESIFDEFAIQVRKADFLTEREKLAAIQKMSRLCFYTGIPGGLKDDNFINQRTYKYNKRYTLYENYFTLLKKRYEFLLNTIGKYIKKDDNDEDYKPDLQPNAFYVGYRNEIFLSMGYVLPPFYHPKYPSALKYGVLGFVIAHELMHAFDSASINHMHSDVFTENSTFQAFTNKEDCLINQFSRRCTEGYRNRCIDGHNTLRENIADGDGVKLAYKAYKSSMQMENEKSSPTNLLPYKDDQIFFISFARSFCANWRTDAGIIEEGNSHAPARARVEISLQNFADASHTFHCDNDSRLNLNPTSRCNVWMN